MDKFFKIVGVVVCSFAGIVLLALLMGYPTKWVVNYLFTSATLIGLFGIPQLTIWKAIWLNFICGTLFKGASSSSSK